MHQQDRQHYMTISLTTNDNHMQKRLFSSQQKPQHLIAHFIVHIYSSEHSMLYLSISHYLPNLTFWGRYKIKIQRTSEIGTTSEERTKGLFPKCPLFGGSTVYICIFISCCHVVPRCNKCDIAPFTYIFPPLGMNLVDFMLYCIFNVSDYNTM